MESCDTRPGRAARGGLRLRAPQKNAGGAETDRAGGHVALRRFRAGRGMPSVFVGARRPTGGLAASDVRHRSTLGGRGRGRDPLRARNDDGTRSAGHGLGREASIARAPSAGRAVHSAHDQSGQRSHLGRPRQLFSRVRTPLPSRARRVHRLLTLRLVVRQPPCGARPRSCLARASARFERKALALARSMPAVSPRGA